MNNPTTPYKTDPILLDEQSVPDGWTLVPGTFLQATARAAAIPYRVAYRTAYNAKGEKSYHITCGIIIPTSFLPSMEKGIELKIFTKIQKQKWKQSAK